MGAADEAHEDRPDASPRSDCPEKGEWGSENAYIGGSDAHDVRPARSTPEVERIARRSRTDDDAPPAIATTMIIFLFNCFDTITSKQEFGHSMLSKQ